MALLLAALFVLLLFRWRRGACLLLAVLLAGYGLLWAPAYSLSAAHAVDRDADAAALTAVCDGLIERLNARKDFALPNDLGARALEAARLVETPAPISAAPKFARYPEWMRAFSLAGLYVPWTAEALCDPTAPAAGQPFTAVHELMHMGGVADEGQANISLTSPASATAGIFAASRRPLGAQIRHGRPAPAGRGCLVGAPGRARRRGARRFFFALGGASSASLAEESVPRPGGAGIAGDYGALAAWLAARIV